VEPSLWVGQAQVEISALRARRPNRTPHRPLRDIAALPPSQVQRVYSCSVDDQLPLPFVFQEPDPSPRPDRVKAVEVQRKPAQREAAVLHPEGEARSA
jgi:hypothetical protein